MKIGGKLRIWSMLVATGMVAVAQAQRQSLLDSDPEVVYTQEFSQKKIELLVVKPGPIYSSKKGKLGGTWLGQLKKDTKAELVGFNETAYKVRGTSDRGGVSGWVSPKILASKDKDFVSNLKKVYKRQIEVRDLIKNKEVAIGMSMDEAAESLGRPTKTKVRQTAKGQSGQWEFIKYDQISHYQNVVDPVSGGIYRRLTHVTKEEINKLVVEFENNIVTAIEESENNAGGSVKIVVPPLVLAW